MGGVLGTMRYAFAGFNRYRDTLPGALAMLAVLLLLVAACVGTGPLAHPDPPAPSGLATFHDSGLVFNYPATWRMTHPSVDSSFSHLIADLATVDIPTPCATTVTPSFTEIACADRYQLVPSSIVVSVSAGGSPGFDITMRPKDATPLTVGGLPAYVEPNTDATTTEADLSLAWTISHPQSVGNFYMISARMRGPGLTQMRSQLDALIGSIHYDPPVVPLPSGTAAAEAALAKALAVLVKQSSIWGCFPTHPGTGHMLISTLPDGPPLAKPQIATCTSEVEATPLQLWRVTLTIRLPKADPSVGKGLTTTQWVNPDGTLGAQIGGPVP